ncbi:MAG TPA: RHS repeat-associated core domain-containing protein [Pyrinomonadaceae bacterium]|nr:RHS repeat-associated core domain-containing protein [Pyrinomonadaceae bacterium]
MSSLFSACLSITLMLSLLLSSSPTAPQTVKVVTNEVALNLTLWYHNSSVGYLLQGRGLGARKRQESQDERDSRIARLEIFPKDVSVDLSDRVRFAAVAYDGDDNPVAASRVVWSGRGDTSAKRVRMTQQGDFEAITPGSFTITARLMGRTAETSVTVRATPRRDLNATPTRAVQVSSRDVPTIEVASAQEPKNSQERLRKTGRRGAANASQKSHASKAKAPAGPTPMLPNDGWDGSNYWSADDPGNGVGDPPTGPIDGGAGSGNFQFVAPIYSTAGRGVNVSLTAAYNARLWNKANNQISYDNDRGWPAPGFSLGFGKMLALSINAGCMLVDADGTRHSFNGSIQFFNWGTIGTFHTTDGSFIDYTYQTGTNGVITFAEAKLPNGTVITYGAHSSAGGGVFPTSIVDAQGNFITITYVNNSGPRIQTVTDTVGRVLNFHYNPNNLLTAITAPGYITGTRTLVRFHYKQLALNPGFVNTLTVSMRDANPWVVDAIYYPGTSTGFWLNDSNSYSSYGMLAKVVEARNMGFSASSLTDMGTVTQGSVTREQTYEYPLTPNNSLNDAPTYGSSTERWTRDGTNFDTATTLYDIHENDNPRMTIITRPNGTKLKQLAYNAPNQPIDGVVYHEETYVTDGQPLLMSHSTWVGGAYDSPRVTRVEKTDERGQMMATEFSYGTVYNQVTEIRDYDYGGTTLLRKTTSTYQNSANYTNRHIFSLPLVVDVLDASGVRQSRVEYQYDGQTLEDAPGVGMHYDTHNPYATQWEQCTCRTWDHWQIDCLEWDCQWLSDYNPATDYRGNVTSVTTYADGTNLGGAIVESRRYDIAGNMVKKSVITGEQTTFNYNINTQFAYATSKTRGSDSDPFKQVTTSTVYDLNTGLARTGTNANGNQSTTDYAANTLRPTSSISTTGAHIDYSYDDTGLSITTTSYLASADGGAIADQNVKYLNGRGTVRQEKALGVGGVWDIVDTTYDSMGQVTQQTRPYRTGETPQATVTTYDALGRTKTVTSPDGSVTQSFYNEAARPSVASANPGESMRVQDAWGRERWARTDSSGRLVEVVEPDPNGSGSVATNGLVTTYGYNVLGNMTSLNQGPSQSRSFKYDSLNRLIAQRLAEPSATLNDAGTYVGSGTWSDVFTYDERSNLTSRTDARGVKTVYTFNNDPLNRLQSTSWDTTGFGDTSNPIASAATVTYSYRTKDTGAQLRDVTQLSSVSTANVGTESYTYDPDGRISARTLTLTSRSSYPFVTDYIYDSLDRVKNVIYPAQTGNGSALRKTVHHDYDVASRVTGVTYDGQTQASNITYNAFSSTTSLNVGTGPNQISEAYNYNSVSGFLDSQTVARGATTLLNLSYDYANANGKRTGQLKKLLNNLNHNKDRAYSYDALGRLVQATGGPSAAPIWTQTYTYDRFGNRTGVSANGFSAKYERGVGPRTEALLAKNTFEPPPYLRDETRSVSDSPLKLWGENSSTPVANTPPAPPQGGPPTFTDDPLVAGTTTVKALHVTELRDAINLLRVRAGIATVSWAESVSAGVLIKASHITEMRTRLEEARTALALAPTSYTDPSLTVGTLVKAAHIQEIRDSLKAAWNTSTQITRDGHASLSYAVASNRITTAGFAYDAAGNQVRALIPGSSSTSRRYKYDAANRLVNVKTDDNATTLSTYTYGDSNERLIVEENGTRTYYVGDAGSTVAEFTESGAGVIPTWARSYVYLGARLLSIVTPSGGGGEFVEYHHPDRLGTRIVSNPATGTSYEQVGLPFGTALTAESTGATTRRFTSYERSNNTQLDYAVNRHYDSYQGRFMQVDPIGMKSTDLQSPQTLNLYAYCTNDPVNHTDPSGLGFFSWLKKLFQSIGKILSAVGRAMSRILNNRWVRIGVFILGFILPGLHGLLATIVEWTVRIYNFAADIASQLQLWGALLEGHWRDFGAMIGLAIGGSALSQIIDPIVSGVQDALFKGKNLLDSVSKGLKDGFKRLGKNLTRQLKEIFIPFYGIYGGPGNPDDKQWDDDKHEFKDVPAPIDDTDIGYRNHDVEGRLLGDLEDGKVITAHEHRVMRRLSDRKLVRHLLSHAPMVHLLDVAFSASSGGRPLIGSGYKLFALTGFTIRGYVLR